jgi:hypothetical protein
MPIWACHDKVSRCSHIQDPQPDEFQSEHAVCDDQFLLANNAMEMKKYHVAATL